MVYNLELTLKEEFLKAKEQGIQQGIEQGKKDGILELLWELGSVPEDLENKIRGHKDISDLSKWLKFAARSSSIEEFQKKMEN